MSDSLRQVLKAVDGSAPSIQRAASAMMKHYDTTAAVAVTAWRDVLSTARSDLHLPLLYVCNEVLQISKRNRGSKFLEAFAGVLGPCCIHICKKDPQLTEKVRRTVKIWGDRNVFSVRYVQELLKGLEPFRGGGGATSSAPRSHSRKESAAASNLPKPPAQHFVDTDDAQFSDDEKAHKGEVKKEQGDVDDKNNNDDDDDDDILQILEQDEPDDRSADDEGEDDVFASSAGGNKLEIDIDLDKMANQPVSSRKTSHKRRRSSMESAGSQGSASKRRRRRAVYSIPNLVDTLTRLSTLQQNYDYSQLGLQKIDVAIEKTSQEELEALVGDELHMTFRQTQDYLKQIQDQRKEIYENAQERHKLERETVGYINWLEKALNLDDDDIKFCDKLEKDILAFQRTHAEIRQARDLRRAEEQRLREEAAEKERRRREEEEAERFRKAALQRNTVGGQGLIWNPSTREYQERNTDESWRD